MLAQSLTDSTSSRWRAKGDQRRTYHFTDANSDEPFRVCVPDNRDGTTKLPLAMFLHGAGSNESTYLDQNNKQMVNLAGEHGFLLVSPMGDRGAYGNFLRLTALFGKVDTSIPSTSHRILYELSLHEIDTNNGSAAIRIFRYSSDNFRHFPKKTICRYFYARCL